MSLSSQCIKTSLSEDRVHYALYLEIIIFTSRIVWEIVF
jgi:hypothetical protein